MSWSALESGNPELAAFGAARLHGQVSYLATLRADGGPRVHPVTPIARDGHLFLFMEPTSPKAADLRRDGRYALHCGVGDNEGTGGEFAVSGRAREVLSDEQRALALRLAPYEPPDRCVLFEFDVARALSTVYEGGETLRRRWSEGE